MLFGRFIDHEPDLYQLAFPMSHLEPPQPPWLRGEQLENRCQTQTQLVLKLWEVEEQFSLDTAFAQTQILLVQYFGEAALRDTSLEQLDSIFCTENLPQQQKLRDKGYSHLHPSACGRPRSHLLETSDLTHHLICQAH